MITDVSRRRSLVQSHVSMSLIRRTRSLTELMIQGKDFSSSFLVVFLCFKSFGLLDMVYVPVFGLRTLEPFTEWVRGWRLGQSGPTAGWSGTSTCRLEAARTQEQDERAQGTHWSCSRRRKLSVSRSCNDQSNQSIIIHHHRKKNAKL